MKAKVLLSAISAFAIVATAGISFATWDVKEATATGLTFDIAKANTIAFSSNNVTWASNNSELSGGGTLTGTVALDVKNAPAGATMEVLADNLSVTDTQNALTITVTPTTESVTALAAGGNTTVTCDVTVKMDETKVDDTNRDALSGKSVTFDLTATEKTK